jgi:L-fuconolactonase
MTFIDPHVHFFALEKGNYAWLKPDNPPNWPDKAAIAHCTSEQSLIRASYRKIAGFVHIEAGFDNARPWREIHYLMEHCHLPFKSIACIDLTSPGVYGHIDYLSRLPSVVGLRHILDSEATELLSHPKVKHVLRYMSERGLLFEAQFDTSNANATAALLGCIDLIPSLNVIVNHAGTNGLNLTNSNRVKGWQTNILALGNTSQVGMKLSGWEMKDRNWSLPAVNRVCQFLFEHVGHNKLMLASNYPLCQWRLPYHALWQAYQKLISQLPISSQRSLLGENASHWYKMAAK